MQQMKPYMYSIIMLIKKSPYSTVIGQLHVAAKEFIRSLINLTSRLGALVASKNVLLSMGMQQ